MGYTTPTTRTNGEFIDMADWNTDVTENIKFLANPPSCRVYNTGNQTALSGVDLTLQFNAERWDTNSMHSTSVNTNRITINTAGLYVVTGTVEIAPSAAGTKRYVYIGVNNSFVVAITNIPFAAGPVSWGSVSTVWKFNAGDYCELKVQQDSGASLTVFADASFAPEFSATWIGRG